MSFPGRILFLASSLVPKSINSEVKKGIGSFVGSISDKETQIMSAGRP